MGNKKTENASELYFKLHIMLKDPARAEAIKNNIRLLEQLSEYLPRIAKDNCDINLQFDFDGEPLFKISSSSDKLPVFRVNVNSMDNEAFEKLMYGQMKCSAFLLSCLTTSLFPQYSNNDQTVSFSPSEMGSSWDRYVKRLGYQEERFFEIDETKEARGVLEANHVLWCHNKSCTGKSYLAINTLSHFGRKLFVYNPTVEANNNKLLLWLTITSAADCGLLIDDLQCDVDLARKLLPYLASHVDDLKHRNVYVLIVSWTSLANSSEFSDYKERIPVIRTRPQKYITLMKERLPNDELRHICGDSLSLINTAQAIRPKASGTSSIAYYEGKLFGLYIRTKDEEQIRLIYVMAVLGTYEFETPVQLLSQYGNIDFSVVPIAKKTENQIYLAHRTVSAFLAHYIEKNYALPISRISIVRKYINQIDSRKKWGALIHLIGEENQPALMSVSPLWNLMYQFQANLKAQTQKDATWANTPSSMYFVLSTADMLGVVDEYTKVIDSLCGFFVVNGGHVEINYGKLKTTKDFIYIQEKMRAEDEIKPPDKYESAESINLEIFHKNWLFGLLIGLKDILIKHGHAELVAAVEKELLEVQDSDGFWYPKRVPWVSARILIGLATAGYTNKDACIKKGVKYLYNVSHEYYWIANTGGWNNEYETTSLCLEALIKCGEDCEGDFLKPAAELLLSKSTEWMNPEMDIDGTTSACALVKIRGLEEKLLSYINSLSERNVHEIVDTTGELDYSENQSCKITQIAYYVIELCWYVLEKQIPELLDKFITRAETEGLETKGDNMQNKKLFISYADEGKYIERFRKIAHHLKSVGYTVLFYDDVPISTNLPEYMNQAEKCDAILVLGTKKYKEKAMEYRAGGVWYEYCVLSQEFMKNHYNKIVPIAFDEFEESLPTIFASNKGMRVTRVDQKFLNELTYNLNKKFEEEV